MSKASLKQLKESITGRRIAVIGNAQSILEHQYGSDIDSHDVVIRLNLGSIVDQVSQGSRTDILGFSFPQVTSSWVEQNLGRPKLIWLTPKNRDNSAYFDSFKQNIYYYPISRWEKLSKAIKNGRPSSGLMMIDLVQIMQPKEINLFGFDFKKTKTYYLKNDHVGPHSWDLEEKLVTKILSNNQGTIY